MSSPDEKSPSAASRFWEVFLAFLYLGCTSFGGPIAHIGYFRKELVERRKWVSEKTYLEAVTLCQFLPGPTSSQIGLLLGFRRGGTLGALAAWLGFTMPSAVLMIILGYCLGQPGFHLFHLSGALHGLRLAAVAIVAQAVVAMAGVFASEALTASVAILSFACVLLWPGEWTQLEVVGGGVLLGLLARRVLNREITSSSSFAVPGTIQLNELGSGVKNRESMAFTLQMSRALLGLFLVLLIGLPILARYTGNRWVAECSAFYQTGSLVFGGGHVVLPLLEPLVVDSGWVAKDQFLSGYGAVQMVPGPLFSYSAFLGTVINHSWLGGMMCLIAIYLPSFLLVFGCLPFWEKLRREQITKSIMKSTNAVVVGLLGGAFITPVCTSSLFTIQDCLVAAIAWILLTYWKAPPIFVVALCGFVETL